MIHDRCVYVYYHHKRVGQHDVTFPYYVGKGTIRRAYDWIRHTRVSCPTDARDIHILGKDMTDADARQAEILLIYLFGRQRDASGPLENLSEGGDGPASDYPLHQVDAANRMRIFLAHNPCFSLTRHRDGYWYSPMYPLIYGRDQKWYRKKRNEQSGLQRVANLPHKVIFSLSERVNQQLPNDALTYAEVVHYESYGNIDCPTKYTGICLCEVDVG